MAQGRSTAIISMIQWIRISRLSINMSLSQRLQTTKQEAKSPVATEWMISTVVTYETRASALES